MSTMFLPFVIEHPVVAQRRAILAHGYQPIAVYNWDAPNCDAPGKHPYGRAWQATRGMPPMVAAALNTGILSRGLRVIDIDFDDERAAQVIALAGETLGYSPLVRWRANSLRRLIVYRGSGKKINLSETDDAKGLKIEIQGDGQQFVAFGRHHSGAEIEWLDDAPDCFARENLPEASEEAIERFVAAAVQEFGLKRLGATREDEAPPAPVPATIHHLPNLDARIKAYVEKAIQDEVRNVANAPKGHGNATLNTAALKLGQLVGAGWAAEGGVVAALLAAAVPRRSRQEAAATIHSGLKAGKAQPREHLEDREPEIPATVVEAAAAMAGAKAKKPAPLMIDLGAAVDWSRPSGLLAEIADWILATSPMPNRPLAVAAATAVISTVCGRHLYSASRTAMNLYIAMLAKTGVGKDRPLSAPGEILKAAGMGPLRQSGKSFAVSGFESMIVDNPCCVAVIDELGANLMSRISHKRSSTHEQAIKPLLLELWSRTMGKDAFMTTHRAQSGSVAVHSPSLTILGSSTPEKFYSTLQNADAADGFMNRFLIAEAAPRSEEDEDVEMAPVPQIVVDCLQGIVPALGGSLGSVLGVFSPNAEVPERKLEWAPWVRDAVRAFKKQVNEIVTDAKHGDLWGRTYEYAIRLGGIHAVSRAGAYADIEMSDMQWGAAWAVSSARAMSDAAENMMSRSNYEADLNEVKKEIKEAVVITRSNLLRAIRHINARDLENITNHLAGAGIIEKQETKPNSKPELGGRPITSYRWKG